MATRKYINIFGNYIVHHKLYAFLIYVLYILKNGKVDRTVLYTSYIFLN